MANLQGTAKRIFTQWEAASLKDLKSIRNPVEQRNYVFHPRIQKKPKIAARTRRAPTTAKIKRVDRDDEAFELESPASASPESVSLVSGGGIARFSKFVRINSSICSPHSGAWP